jgi:hypothetical protein
MDVSFESGGKASLGRRAGRALLPLLAVTLIAPTASFASSGEPADAAANPQTSGGVPASASSGTASVPSSTTTVPATSTTVPSTAPSTTTTVPSTSTTVPSTPSTSTTVPSSTRTTVPAPTASPNATTTPSTVPPNAANRTPAKPKPGPTPVAAPNCPEANPTYTSPCGPTYTLPQWSDFSGWSSPSSYQTIQLANLDGDGNDDLIGRDANGIWVEKFDSSTGQWELQATQEGGLALPLTNQVGWNQPQYYETIQTADVNGDGKAELLARGAAGLHTFQWNPTTDTFVEAGPVLAATSNAAGFSQPQYYRTIQTADVLGNGSKQLLVRGPAGLYTYQWGSTGWTQIGPVLAALSDAAGFNQPQYYETVQTADVLGGGTAQLLARGPDGLRTYQWQGAEKGWTQVGDVLNLSDAGGWNQPQYYRTIQTADVNGDGKAELLARGIAGLQTYEWGPNGWSAVGPALANLSDASGFDQPQYYRTIQTADLGGNGGADLIARTGAGISVYEWNGATRAWTTLSSNALALSDPVWARPEYYDTIHTGDLTGKGPADLIARGPFGIRTFQWDATKKAFVRPLPYGDFPAFTGDEATAYAALGQFLLGRTADFRKETYASPSNAITEATLDRYRSLLAERCTPLVAAQGPRPPTYTDCKPPPSSSVSPQAWTAVSNQIIAELWAAAAAVGYFTILETIELKLFQDQQGTLPALDAALKLPPNPPDRGANYLKLIKSGLEIVNDVLQFFPLAKAFPKSIRAIALVAHSLGAVGEGLGLQDAPSPPARWATITGQVARMQQSERDITEAQRRYVLADYGLLMTVGSLVNGRVLLLDSTAALSAGRLSFAKWVYQLYTPAFWQRYDVIHCSNRFLVSCAVPSGTTVRRTGPQAFLAVLQNTSDCVDTIGTECKWQLPSSDVGSLVWGAVADNCLYNPAPGSTAAWRYGCSIGSNPNDLIDNRAGWQFNTKYCDVRYLRACWGHRP